MTDHVRIWSWLVLAIACVVAVAAIIFKEATTRVVNPVTSSTIELPAHCYPTCSDYDLAVLRSIPSDLQLTPQLHQVQLTRFREWAADLPDRKASESYLFWIDKTIKMQAEQHDVEQRIIDHIPEIPKAVCRERYEPIRETGEKPVIPERLTVITECVTAPVVLKP